MKRIVSVILAIVMAAALFAIAPAARAETVQMGRTIVISSNNYKSYADCTKYYIDINMDLYAWGLNNDGQVGNGTKVDQKKPCKILSNVVSVKSSARIAAALTADGDLYVWGEPIGSLTPYKCLSNVKLFEVIGPVYIMAITENGDLYTAGIGYYNSYSILLGWGEDLQGYYDDFTIKKYSLA